MSNLNKSNESHSKTDVQQNMPHESPSNRDIESEIDWKFIDMYHNVVLNFSRNSMQAKKIMFTLLGIFLAEMLRNHEIYVSWLPLIVVIIVLFWAFDSYTYYYQEKFRALMDDRFTELRKRYPGKKSDDQHTLPDKRQKSGKKRVWRSVLNMSVLFYPIIIVILIVFWVLIRFGYIASHEGIC